MSEYERGASKWTLRIVNFIAIAGVTGGLIFLLLGTFLQNTSHWPDAGSSNWVGAILLSIGALFSAVALLLNAQRMR